jgi:hypothetical protein
MALRDRAVGGSKSDTKASAKHVVAEMEDSRTGVRFPPPPPILYNVKNSSLPEFLAGAGGVLAVMGSL